MQCLVFSDDLLVGVHCFFGGFAGLGGWGSSNQSIHTDFDTKIRMITHRKNSILSSNTHFLQIIAQLLNQRLKNYLRITGDITFLRTREGGAQVDAEILQEFDGAGADSTDLIPNSFSNHHYGRLKSILLINLSLK